MNPVNFRNELALYVISRMSGSSDLDSTVRNRPSKRFIVGSLAPKRYVDTEQDRFYDEYTTEKASIKATRLRVSVLVLQRMLTERREFRIQLTGNSFYKIRSSEINDQAEQGQDRNENNKASTSSKYTWKRKSFLFDVKVNQGKRGEE